MLLKMTELETERLLLREFRQSDLAAIAGWEESLDAERFLEFCVHSYREWGMGPWAVLVKKTGVIVGNCSFCRIRYDRMFSFSSHFEISSRRNDSDANYERNM